MLTFIAHSEFEKEDRKLTAYRDLIALEDFPETKLEGIAKIVSYWAKPKLHKQIVLEWLDGLKGIISAIDKEGTGCIDTWRGENLKNYAVLYGDLEKIIREEGKALSRISGSNKLVADKARSFGRGGVIGLIECWVAEPNEAYMYPRPKENPLPPVKGHAAHVKRNGPSKIIKPKIPSDRICTPLQEELRRDLQDTGHKLESILHAIEHPSFTETLTEKFYTALFSNQARGTRDEARETIHYYKRICDKALQSGLEALSPLEKRHLKFFAEKEKNIDEVMRQWACSFSDSNTGHLLSEPAAAQRAAILFFNTLDEPKYKKDLRSLLQQQEETETVGAGRY